MGVPAFFRWLSRKYPSVIIECVEEKATDPNTGQSNYDASAPNPNGIEFDNLYLDMNGIIHPCTHPEDKPAPKNEDEMMIAIFECIDRLFNIVRPRKLLYMAIDGVAPRAKMNQQRSRRFRAAKEAVEKQAEIERVRSELLAKGCILPEPKPKEHHFDSNCITPGTPFMDRLSKCLHYYIHDRMNNNPAWKKVKVILSDANVPGEGEHKIMDFIRKQRSQPDHDPNTKHVLCGADADLIMLGLATHEPNFTIIREEFLPNKPRPCEICNQFGHEMDKCCGLTSLSDVSNLNDLKPDAAIGAEVKYIFVRLNVLREYLERNLQIPGLCFKYDFERVLDDWVFMCFFVGNDFLPHLPSLEIREGAVDRLIELYKKCVQRTGGYLTDSGEVNLERVQLIMTDLGNMEDQIFKDRQRREKQFQAREKSKRMRLDVTAPPENSFLAPVPLGAGTSRPGIIQDFKKQSAEVRVGMKRTASAAGLDEAEEEVNDEVRLWEDGFKNRYYESKFDVGPNNLGFRYSVAMQYVKGLCWVLKYYYQGCASWNWYFPYHYAPFASDFVNISGLSTAFGKETKPFNPLEQLMGVFPAASGSHVPSAWVELMSDPDSPIIDFYPEDFKIDLNGKKFAWQGVALLPFVDEKRLFKALKPFYNKLTDEEIRRNKQGDSRLYVANHSPHFKLLTAIYRKDKPGASSISAVMDGMRGLVSNANENVPYQGCLESPIFGLHGITDNSVVTVCFKDPEYGQDFVFPAKRLQGAVNPPTVLGPEYRSDNYKPVIGFAQNLPTAQLSSAGHRMLNAGIGNQNRYNPGYPAPYSTSQGAQYGQPNRQYGQHYGNRGQGQNYNRYNQQQMPNYNNNFNRRDQSHNNRNYNSNNNNHYNPNRRNDRYDNRQYR